MGTQSLLESLKSLGINESAAASDLVHRTARPIVIENDRLFAPAWDEAFVDLRSVVAPDAYAALLQVPKWLFYDPMPRAFAVAGHEGGLILVSEGLAGLIAFCSFHTAAASVMAADVTNRRQIEPFEHLFIQIVTNHFQHGWSLPDSIDATHADGYHRMIVSRDSMMLLVLLHELGHIVRGHLEGRLVGDVDFLPRVADLTSHLHLAEIEADDYAMAAIVNTDVLNLSSTLLAAWTYAEVGRRVTRGGTAHLSVTHPLTINRLSHLARHIQSRLHTGVGNASRLELGVEWRADLVEAPAEAGLEAVPFTAEDGLARHRTLIAQHLDCARPFI
jgi:hypothetical protein